jgi:hypothetical protein
MGCAYLTRSNLATAIVIFVFAACAAAGLPTIGCLAKSVDLDPPPAYQAQPDVRSGGVLEESFRYHRAQPMCPAGATRSVEPAGGWYGYGFPVQTFRWGWFGASHYYPYVWWHDGYYGDCCRYAYRRGY